MDLTFSMYDYYQMVKKNHIDIIYSGPIWVDGVTGIGEAIQKRLAFDELPLTSAKSVFGVFVEQMNNMLMYSAEKQHYAMKKEQQEMDASAGVFVLGVVDKVYFLKSGNLIENNRVESLKSKIDYLNTLDRAGLKKYYKEQIRSEIVNPDSLGAGIGLIEIAKRSSSKINYEFVPMDDKVSFFSMSVTVGGGDERG